MEEQENICKAETLELMEGTTAEKTKQTFTASVSQVCCGKEQVISF